MKILYLHQYFTTPEYNGGVRSYQLARRLTKHGHDVDIITSTAFFSPPSTSKFRLISRHAVEGITVHAINIKYCNEMSFFRRVCSFCLFVMISSCYVLFLPKRKIVIATSTPLTIAIPALIYHFVWRARFVFEVRDLWPDIPIALGFIKSKLIRFALNKIELYTYKKANKIISLSPGMTCELKKKGVNERKIVEVPNGCDIEDFFSNNQGHPYIQEICTCDSRRICLYAGTFGFVNNLSYIIKLAEEVKKNGYKIIFLLVGKGKEKIKITEEVERKKLSDIVFFLPPVSKNELISIIETVDACISTVLPEPVLYNNSANKFFDSLAAGKPIIINHHGWQAEFIKRNNVGLVLDYDYKKSACKLNDFVFGLKESDKLRIKLVAEDNFSREMLFARFYQHAIICGNNITDTKQ